MGEHGALVVTAVGIVGKIGTDPAFGQQRGRGEREVAAGDGAAIALS